MPGMMQRTGMERRAAADKERMAPAGSHGGGEGHVVTIQKSGNGYTAKHEDGEETQHEHLHGAMAEAGSRHMGGVHHMAHHDGMGGGVTTHHAMHGEPAEGPTEHGDVEEAVDHMKSIMSGDTDEDGYEPEEAMPGGGRLAQHEGRDY